MTQVAENPDIELAIVIPAYREQFLASTLDSIASQTDRRFRVYVGDDCSPSALEAIVRRAAVDFEIRYRRFPENLGATSLVQHWDRCIKQTNESWIWLFSDDDVMEPECVAAFYRELERTKGTFDLYRFDTFIIDAEDRVQIVSNPHPEVESAFDFAYHRLRGERHSTVQELVFSRSAYDRVGGFLDLPCAWCSDDAGVIRLAGRSGIRKIAGPRVRFRRSGMNLSSTLDDARVNRDKRRAVMAYLDWLMEHFRCAESDRTPQRTEKLRREAKRWFVEQCMLLETTSSLAEADEMARFYSRTWGGWRQRHFLWYLKRNCQLLFNRILKQPTGQKSVA